MTVGDFTNPAPLWREELNVLFTVPRLLPRSAWLYDRSRRSLPRCRAQPKSRIPVGSARLAALRWRVTCRKRRRACGWAATCRSATMQASVRLSSTLLTNLAGISAKLLSLGDFGIIVEGVIVMTEARPAAARGEA